MKETEEKLKLLDTQIIGSIFFIITLLVSILLTINQRNYTLNKKPLFNAKTTYVISNANRIVVLCIVITFLYISYKQKKLAEAKDSNVTLNNWDLFAGTLSVISAIIVLYITINSPVEDALNIENPNI